MANKVDKVIFAKLNKLTESDILNVYYKIVPCKFHMNNPAVNSFLDKHCEIKDNGTLLVGNVMCSVVICENNATGLIICKKRILE